MSAVGCFGRFTFSHLAFHIPTLAGSCLCLFCVVVCLVALFLCFWFLFCKCLGIPNSPRSLDLDDRQGLIARSAMQQKKKKHVLHHPSKVLYDPETEQLFLPLFWFYPIYREMLNTASRHRPSKSMELRRAASGLVKVICRTEDSRPGGGGKKPGKPKQKGLLANFEEWFGSINMMNILYVWFPASWGPSVVEAIQTRNATCLAKKPIVRDPHIFDRKEAARGSRAREVTCRIQKWNIKAEGFHPLLVANQELTGLPWRMRTLQRSFPFCSRVYCRMCIRKGRPLRGKVPNRKNLLCQCSYQGPALRQNGESYYNPDANSGLHLPLGMPLLYR